MGRLCFVLALVAVPLCLRALVAQSEPAAKEAAVAERPAVELPAEVNPAEVFVTRRVRRLLQSELWIVRRACRPTKQQLEEISRAGDEVVSTIVGAVLESGVDSHDGMVINRQTSTQWEVPLQYQKLVSEKLAESLKTTLSAEAAAQYQQECDERLLNWKEAVADYMVAQLDNELALSAAQRATISGKFVERWPSEWDVLIENCRAYFPSGVPEISDELIVPYLTEAQYKIWSSPIQAGRTQARMMLIRWGMGAPRMEDDLLDEIEVRPADEESPLGAPNVELSKPGAAAPETPKQEEREG